MGTRQVRVEYTGGFEFDIDEGAIVDDLAPGIFGDDDPGPSDDAIVRAIDRDIAAYMEHGDNIEPPSHRTVYDRDRLIESVRAEIARRRAEASE